MNKKLLCTAVGGALAAGLSASAAFGNHDDNLLVPYVVKDTNRTTVVTIIGEGQPVKDGATLHLQYWTKSTTAANTAACDPSSVTVPFTDFDIMTFDTAGLLGYPLFGDTTNPAPLGTSISYAAPRHGYLAVEWLDGSSGTGYWMELDLANGGAQGDRVYHGNDGGKYAHVADSVSLWPYGPSGWSNPPVAFWPSSVATTVFTVTPLGTAMLTKENNQVAIQVFNYNNAQGAYDRNENGVDGTVPVTVRCVGRVTVPQLMPGVVTNAAWAAQGGWGFLANLGDGDGTYNESSKFLSNATRVVNQPEPYQRNNL